MESRQAKYPLGSLSRVEAKSFGEPGSRTFQLVLEAGQAHCTLWLEKELLFQLGLRIQAEIQQLPSEQRERPSRPVDGEWFGQQLSLDFKAGQMSLSYGMESNSFESAAYEAEDEESGEEASSVSFWITTDQAAVLAEEALRICAAGRPRCFLCGLPIDAEGHVCPRSNGHVVLEAG